MSTLASTIHRAVRRLSNARAGALVLLAAASGVALVVACSSPDPGARVDPIGPDEAQFKSLAPVITLSCGSLDCHGSRYRNFRAYGFGGARLDAGGATPETRGNNADELRGTYESIIGLEPEIMRDVVKSGGKGVDRLTFVRKARGTEAHKGNQRIKPGTDADRCLVTWLATSAGGSNAVDTAACLSALCVLDPSTTGCPAP
jgi:hypothetical protein